MLRGHVEQILKIYHYLDGVLICDRRGRIEYYTNFRPDINSLTEKEVLGRYILDVYPSLEPDQSCILRVLASGEPIYNEVQDVVNCHGEKLRVVNTTLPIRLEDGTLVGAVDVSRFIDRERMRKDITLASGQGDRARPEHGLYTLDDIYGESRSLFSLKEKINRIADTPSTVMIHGETGTGKEMFAQAIHSQGVRRKGPFISQNCAAIPSSLLESLLFGTEKGSFTGAVTKAGLFELANGGTLFLDEINAMEPAVQPKILKAIDEKQIRRIGGTRTIHLDLRVVCALNEDPHEAVDQGRLRKDLFFRLATVLLPIPPLRERMEDIPLLVKKFIHDFNLSMNMHVEGAAGDVEAVLGRYDWPGNVRELKNVIEGAFNLVSGPLITRADLPEYLFQQAGGPGHPAPAPGASLAQIMGDLEQHLLREALDGAKTLSAAAEQLRMSKQSLHYKLRKYHLR
ncbi:MAG: sigma 54-interacting transcriptional regulator [Holophaga sp.]|jgi:arginine utilization regulatory protein